MRSANQIAALDQSTYCHHPPLGKNIDMLSWLGRLFQGEMNLGMRGENLAARFLRNLGYKIIQRNFRCDVGEVDIVAKDGGTLVFVEVKTRVEDDPMPEAQVNKAKRHQATKAARVFLARYGQPQPPARFDVVAIVCPDGEQPVIRHTTNAFDATF